MQLSLIKKKPCGITRYYPDCDKSKYFIKHILKTKTITPSTLAALRELGWYIKIKESLNAK